MRRTLLLAGLIWGGAGALAQAPEGAGAAAPVECVAQAHQRTELSEHDAVLLCRGAKSSEPVECYLEGKQETSLPKHDLLTLCSPLLSAPVPAPYR